MPVPNTTAPEAQSAPAAEQTDPNEMVSIFNKSPKYGDYVHGEYRAEAGAFTKVPRWLADKWKKMFPGVIVDPSGVGAPRGHSPSNAEVVQLRKENSDLAERVKNMEKLVSDLRANS